MAKFCYLVSKKKGWVGVCGLQLIQSSLGFETMAESWYKLEISKNNSTFPVWPVAKFGQILLWMIIVKKWQKKERSPKQDMKK